MRRRDFLALAGGTAIAWWSGARAQDWERDRIYKVAFLLPTPRKERLRKLAILADARVTKPSHLQQLEEAARNRGIEPLVRGVAKRDDVISAIKEVKAAGGEGINFLATPLFSVNAVNFIAQVRDLRLASIYQWPEDAEDGG